MAVISIFVGASVSGAGIKNQGIYVYIIEFTSGSRTEIRSGSGSRTQTNEIRLVLEAVREAVSRLIKSCSVQVFTRCEAVSAAVRNGWLERWKSTGFVTARGNVVKTKDLWEGIMREMDRSGSEFADFYLGGVSGVYGGNGRHEKTLLKMLNEEKNRCQKV